MSAKHHCNRDGSKNWSYPVNFLTSASVGRSRTALLASASAFALAALGASGLAAAACVPSPQIIATPISGPIFSNGGAITVTAAGGLPAVPAATVLTPYLPDHHAHQPVGRDDQRRNGRWRPRGGRGRVERQHDHDADQQRDDQRR